MESSGAERLQKLNLAVLGIVIVISIVMHDMLKTVASVNCVFNIVLSIVASYLSYTVIICIIYLAISHSKLLLKLYWGKLYLDGFWAYEYKVQGKTVADIKVGIWKIEQNLAGTKITGFGYTNDLQDIRTRLNSVTELINNRNCFEITHKKTETSNPNAIFYATSSLSTFSNPSKSILDFHPIKFTAFTYIYGGSSFWRNTY